MNGKRIWLALILALSFTIASRAEAQPSPIGDFANGALCAPVTGYGLGDVSVVVTTGCGARFPSTPFYATWWNNTDYPGGFTTAGARDPNYEVILVTNVSADTLTVTRAQQGTTATSKNAGGKTYFIAAGATAAAYDNINTALGASAVTLGTNSVLTNERVLTGTSNQITVTDNGAGSTVVLSTPQAIATTSTPTFEALTLTTTTSSPAFSLTRDDTVLVQATSFSSSAVSTATNWRQRRARGSAAAPRRAQSDDYLGIFQFQGAYAVDDATTAAWGSSSAVIRALASENFTVSARGARLEFLAAPVGGDTAVVGLTVTSAGAAVGTATTGMTVPKFLVVSDGTSGNNQIRNYHSSSDNAAGSAMFIKSQGTSAQLYRVQSGNNLASINAAGFYSAVNDTTTGTEGSQSGQFQFFAAETFTSATNLGTNFRVNLTPVGSGTIAEAMRLTSEKVLKLAGTAVRGTTEGSNHLDIFCGGTAPVGTLTNGVSLYCNGDQLRAMDAAGVSQRLTYPLTKSITIEDPTNAEDLSMWFADDAITITKMVVVLIGSTPSITWTVRHGTDRSAAGAEVVTGGTTTSGGSSTTTGQVVTSFNDATIVADSFVWFETTAKSGTVNQINLTIYYTVD